MIATLQGKVSEKLAEAVVLDVGGVGYGLQMPVDDFIMLKIGETVKVYVYEHIREISHDLYGFSNLHTLELFKLLLGVKNVGPKVARAVLDIGSTDTVKAAIASGDIKQLQGAKGVGRRAAEQIVVELRDKVGISASEAAEGIVNRPGVASQDEAVEALVALGFSPQDASLALKDVDNSLTSEERIKLALRGK